MMNRVVYQGLGIGFVGLAIAGALVPLLPSTPFLLLASGCFARSSPRWRDWLYRSPLFGSALRDWNQERVVQPATKGVAIGSMLIAMSATLASGQLPWLVNVGAAIISAIAVVIVLRLPSRVSSVKEGLDLV